MPSETKYKCLSFSPFDTWRYGFLAFIALFIIALIISRIGSAAFLWSVLAVLVYFLVSIVGSITSVTRNENSVEVRSIKGKLSVENIESVETWWCYEMEGSTSTYELGSPNNGPLRGHSNKINVYARFTSIDEELLIYEQIHLGEKFSNEHRYLPDATIAKHRLVRVWDVDKCLAKLGWTQRNTIQK